MGSKLKKLVCVQCNAEFESYNTAQLCCSQRCNGQRRARLSRVACECRHCKKTFYVTKCHQEEGRGLFCSRRCCGASQRLIVGPVVDAVLSSWTEGLSCRQVSIRHNLPEMTVARFLKDRGIFERRHARGPRAPGWVDGRSRSRAYREVAEIGPDSSCARCGYNKVPGILIVHHKDRDRANSAPENLVILCPNCHDEDHYAQVDGRFTAKKAGPRFSRPP